MWLICMSRFVIVYLNADEKRLKNYILGQKEHATYMGRRLRDGVQDNHGPCE